MAFCANCGTSLSEGAAFCGFCGTAAGGVRAASLAVTPAASGMASNVAGLLTYVPFVGWIIAIVFLIVEPYSKDKFVRFHAFQSIFFSVATIAISIAFSIVSGIIESVTGGWAAFVMLPVSMLLWLLLLAVAFFLMYKAYNNVRFMLPFIGALAAKQAA